MLSRPLGRRARPQGTPIALAVVEAPVTPAARPRLALSVLLACVLGGVLAQAPPRPGQRAAPERLEAFDAPQRMTYEERIRKTRLDGHYIPYDLKDAMRELEDITPITSQNAYASREEDFVVRKLYFSFGRWLGVNWSRYEGSRLSAYLNDLGVDTPDGQIELLMRLYHRHLNGKELDVRPLVEAYKAERAAEEEARRARSTVLEVVPPGGEPVENGNPRRG